MDSKDKVLFDPGYAPLVMDSLGVAGYVYYMFCANNNMKFRKLNFPHTLRKIEDSLKVTISFYLGCMLWASYLKSIDGAEIEGNQVLGETVEEKEYLGELDFLIDLVENKLPKDSKYYLGKPYEADYRYLPILKAYREFLKINKGFVECNNTNKIELLDTFKTPKNLENIHNNIIDIINNKDITPILDMYDVLF